MSLSHKKTIIAKNINIKLQLKTISFRFKRSFVTIFLVSIIRFYYSDNKMLESYVMHGVLFELFQVFMICLTAK